MRLALLSVLFSLLACATSSESIRTPDALRGPDEPDRLESSNSERAEAGARADEVGLSRQRRRLQLQHGEI